MTEASPSDSYGSDSYADWGVLRLAKHDLLSGMQACGYARTYREWCTGGKILSFVAPKARSALLPAVCIVPLDGPAC